MNDQEVIGLLQEAFDSAWKDFSEEAELSEKQRQVIEETKAVWIDGLLPHIKQSLQKRGLSSFSESFRPRLLEISRQRFFELFRHETRKAISQN